MFPLLRIQLITLALLLPGFSHAGWEKLFSAAPVVSFVAFDDVIVVGSDSGCYRSLDRGTTWTFHEVDRVLTVTQSVIPLGVVSLCRNTHYLFAATGAGIYASGDTGQTWHPLGPFPDGKMLFMIKVYAQGGTLLCTMAGGGLFRSTDSGTNWTYLGPHRQYDYSSQGTSLFAAAMDGIWYSLDTGSTWMQSSGFPSYKMALHLAGHAGYLYADAYDLLYCSRDAGESWQVLDTGMPFSEHHLEGLFATDSLLFVGLSEHLIYLSRDYGQSWTNISAGLDTLGDPASMNQFGRNGNKVFCNKDGALWSYDLSQVTGVRPFDAEGPEDFELCQNYPNPFNPVTAIRYTVGGTRVEGRGTTESGAGVVTLKVYDLLGREVTTLVNERKAAGSYEVSYDGSGLSSGVYFYRLTAGLFVRSRRMLLIK